MPEGLTVFLLPACPVAPQILWESVAENQVYVCVCLCVSVANSDEYCLSR